MIRLRDLREDNNYTQLEISKIINCKQNTYQQYETEKRQTPMEIMKQLAILYKTSIDYIVGLTDDPRPYPRAKK